MSGELRLLQNRIHVSNKKSAKKLERKNSIKIKNRNPTAQLSLTETLWEIGRGQIWNPRMIMVEIGEGCLRHYSEFFSVVDSGI